MRQIIKEIKDLTTNPPEGIKMIPNEEDLSDFQAAIDGPGNIILQHHLLINSWHSLRRRTIQNQIKVGQRLPFCTTKRILSYQDFPPQRIFKG